ncbi:tRNA-aminoacylation cofactor arc1 [Zancudomyces culisetae]|uniref:tRNA-aminoacylation cofactor arc1 n=1 Tax=Zancudomyces culisetae TaxID=1213189 RepID=A0A1R1PWK7_ZANCU|nr:tRNA-aminoacylation cofactor arc1 [Zancudomyces culisetae]|eukprot:OMH85348.1 tRNA-aminoacylation cofactor arc1 [Zancudomyces culisetae]
MAEDKGTIKLVLLHLGLGDGVEDVLKDLILTDEAQENAKDCGIVNTKILKLALENSPAFAGASEIEKSAVSQYLTMSSRTGNVNRSNLVTLINGQMENKKYLVNENLCLADIVVFSRITEYVKKGLSEQKRKTLSNFIAWYEQIQKDIGEKNIKAAGLEYLDFSQKEAEGNKTKKQKNRTSGGKQATSAVPETIIPSMIDMRVGRILTVKRHEQADSLYVEEIDVGEETPRTVVSGLVNFIPIEQMQNRTIIVICNLKPATMRGVKSQAMVLCADSPDGKQVQFVEPPFENCAPGDRIVIEGFEDEKPVEGALNPKKKVWETVQKGLFTNKDCVAVWKDVDGKEHRLMVNGKECKSQTIADGILK